MSITLTLSSISSELSANYFPPIVLDGEYECALTDFHSYNSIPNVDIYNNKFHIGEHVIEIPIGSYELNDIVDYIKEQYKRYNPKNKIDIEANNNTMQILLGFAEDYNKIILNGKHELILLRNKNDADLVYSSVSTEKGKMTISNISWRIPHVQLSDFSKLNIIKTINSGASIPIAFRSWDCHINPLLNIGTNHIWNVKLAANRERPRFVLVAFQNDDKFVHCDLTNMKVHLNSESYPYDDLNVKFKNERFAILYDMYLRFQQNYYMKDPQPLLTSQEFKNKAPIIVIDVSHQNESISSGPIDIKIEFETSTNIPANTSAYCILIHDRIIEYIPLKGQVRKVL
ncbi:uncharacterized protein LOC135963024 [Calliphora vicina]|uniref:uncharacterized protein LOC135950368 n=1 Tax=Calliphora vicina TaxID=7373 RepID=UPI00325A6621